MKRDQRLIQSENAIIEAGIRTLLANPSAGMSEIAKAAKVGRATLYRHFDSREALIQKIAVICLQEINDATESFGHLNGRDTIEAIIEVVMPLANRFSFLNSLWDIAADDEVVKSIAQQQFDEMSAIVEEAKTLGQMDAVLPTVWIVALFEGVLAAAWELMEAGSISSDEAVQYAKRSFFNGCAQHS
ncbi:MAG: TetR/AcrR family transcriptional regulator [Chloroflexota bacterium]